MAVADLCYIDETGFHYADFPTTLAYFQDAYRTIYGQDVYLEPDSQDGQWVTIQAQAIYDTFVIAADTYNSYSPATARKDALSRNVKLNGIRRKIPSASSADLTIVGQAGQEIVNGQAQDTAGVRWNLPPSVIIPLSGVIVVTATAAALGAVQAAAGAISIIATPTRGWQSVTNAAAATPGAPVETDPELRVRQSVSTALPSLSVLDGTTGAVANTPGVIRYKTYENDSKVTDADGIPGNSISVVVEGGAALDIANAIAVKKTPGTGTYGTTSVMTYDKYGLPNLINFFRPTKPAIKTRITLKALQGYTTGYEEDIATAVTAHYNLMGIGDDVLHSKVFNAANLPGTVAGTTFDISTIELAKNAGAFSQSSVVIAFNEAASGLLADVTFVYL